MNKDIIIISGVIVCISVVIYFICKKKNRNPWGWRVFINLSGFIFNYAPFILLLVLFFMPNQNKKYGGLSEKDRMKDVHQLTKEEYIKKYNDGSHNSKVALEDEWNKEKKREKSF